MKADAMPQTRVNHTPQSFIDHSFEQLRLGDFRQATEKLWGAASLALDEIANKLGYQTQSHNVKNLLFRSLVNQCVDFKQRRQFTQAWHEAQLCHKNFYDDTMDADEVNELGEAIENLVNMMKTLDISKFDKQKFERGLSSYDKSKLF